ncbi:hypothetical protein [Streptomyces sp. NBC_00197]|uniref:hypothetical protein n=1 Tax=Streptomyces sp. NBC_00197 TaxID=2975676 RepID=UPI00324F49E1
MLSEKQNLFLELADEINKDYASILCEGWLRAKNAEKNLKPTMARKIRAEARIYEKAALLVIKNYEYAEEDITPEKRIRRDRERFERAWEADEKENERRKEEFGT